MSLSSSSSSSPMSMSGWATGANSDISQDFNVATTKQTDQSILWLHLIVSNVVIFRQFTQQHQLHNHSGSDNHTLNGVSACVRYKLVIFISKRFSFPLSLRRWLARSENILPFACKKKTKVVMGSILVSSVCIFYSTAMKAHDLHWKFERGYRGN